MTQNVNLFSVVRTDASYQGVVGSHDSGNEIRYCRRLTVCNFSFL